MDNYRPETNGQNPSQFNQFDYGANQGYNQFNYDQSYGAGQGYGQPNYGAGYGQNTGYDQYDYTMDGMNQGFEAGNAVPVMQKLTRVMTSDLMKYSYLFMVVALFITAGAALTTSPLVAYNLIMSNAYWVFIIVELVVVFAAQAAIKKNHAVLAGVLFAVYSYMTGMIFSVLFVIYTGGSLAAVFFICAGMFAATSIYGMITKKDLTSLGSMCMMGLFGLIIAGCVNLFLRNSMLDLITSVIGVVVFVGLTAYDTNKAKRLSETADSSNTMALAMYCALELYLDFINLFLKLLRIMGKRK